MSRNKNKKRFKIKDEEIITDNLPDRIKEAENGMPESLAVVSAFVAESLSFDLPLGKPCTDYLIRVFTKISQGEKPTEAFSPPGKGNTIKWPDNTKMFCLSIVNQFIDKKMTVTDALAETERAIPQLMKSDPDYFKEMYPTLYEVKRIGVATLKQWYYERLHESGD
jgi:hypothetical protein